MKTNYLMLKDLLQEFHPKERGISYLNEIDQITKTLHLREMNVLQLRNMRDFVVLFLGRNNHIDPEKMNILSAITTVIDGIIVGYGEEV